MTATPPPNRRSRPARTLRLALGALTALALLGAAPGAAPPLPAAPAAPLELAGDARWHGEPDEASLAHVGGGAGSADRRGEQFYFVLPDRFANGDPANDRGGLAGDRLATATTRPTRASTTAATSGA
jgi:hypothetical protein